MGHLVCLVGTEATGHSEQSMDVLEPGQQSVVDEGQHEAFLKPNPVISKVIEKNVSFKAYKYAQNESIHLNRLLGKSPL